MQQESARHYGKAILLSFVFLLLALVALSFYNTVVKRAALSNEGTAPYGNEVKGQNAQTWTAALSPGNNFTATKDDGCER